MLLFLFIFQKLSIYFFLKNSCRQLLHISFLMYHPWFPSSSSNYYSLLEVLWLHSFWNTSRISYSCGQSFYFSCSFLSSLWFVAVDVRFHSLLSTYMYVPKVINISFWTFLSTSSKCTRYIYLFSCFILGSLLPVPVTTLYSPKLVDISSEKYCRRIPNSKCIFSHVSSLVPFFRRFVTFTNQDSRLLYIYLR